MRIASSMLVTPMASISAVAMGCSQLVVTKDWAARLYTSSACEIFMALIREIRSVISP